MEDSLLCPLVVLLEEVRRLEEELWDSRDNVEDTLLFPLVILL